MRCTLKKMLYYVITVAIIVGIAAVCMVFADDDNSKNISFLKSYGWVVDEKPIEQISFDIPKEFDEVYKNYNELQNLSDNDLEIYKGKKAMRYTYIVKNFPLKTEQTVRANVISVNGEPVGGDVMTVNIDGFMYSLAYLEKGM